MQRKFLDGIIEDGKKIHLIGIGGVSMSGIASILLDKGINVSGSDMQENNLISKLREHGCEINIGHNCENINDSIGLVVYTAAIDINSNDEIKEAKERGIPLLTRSEFLGEITKTYSKCITISGTHGKTTTTSIFSYVMLYNDLDPTILLGGESNIINGNFRIGKSEYLLLEACEYKESFLKFSTNIGVVLNIDKDHLDYYRDLNHIRNTFKKYIDNVDPNGCLIFCDHDENIRELLSDCMCETISYGLNRGDLRAINIVRGKDYTCFDVLYNKDIYEGFRINVIGDHNILNVLSAVAFSFKYDLNIDKIKKALLEFSLPKRRFEIKGRNKGVLIIEDYAHHPTEIKASLQMTKSISNGKIYCFFQPHTYTRTLTLFDDFSKSFSNADEVILFDIYAAREKDPGTITSTQLGDKIRSYNKSCYNAKNFEDSLSYIKGKVSDGDVLIIIGAGNIGELSNRLINFEL